MLDFGKDHGEGYNKYVKQLGNIFNVAQSIFQFPPHSYIKVDTPSFPNRTVDSPTDEVFLQKRGAISFTLTVNYIKLNALSYGGTAKTEAVYQSFNTLWGSQGTTYI